jgi:hypothetical protein
LRRLLLLLLLLLLLTNDSCIAVSLYGRQQLAARLVRGR